MKLGPMGRALHSVNAVGGGSENRELGGSRARLVCALGRRKEREKLIAKSCGNVRLEFILLPGLGGGGSARALLEALPATANSLAPEDRPPPIPPSLDSSAVRRTLF